MQINKLIRWFLLGRWSQSSTFIVLLSFLVASPVAGAADAQDNITPITVPSWGGLELQGLTVENDFRELDVAVPLPALPYMPKMSFHRYAYETKGRFGGWQKGGARVLKAYLPFGLELEAGHRLDRFGHRESEFVGLTFTYSHLQDHHENWHYGRLGADRGAPMPEHIGTDRGKVSFWQLARPIFLGAAMALALDADSETTVTGSDSGGQLPGDNGGGGSGSSGSGSTSGSGTAPNPATSDNGWQLVWQDEFEGTSLDTVNNWSTNDMYLRDEEDRGATACFGGGNGEAQCYTSRPDNISISQGNLELIALIENYTATNNYGEPATRDYTSGRIHTRFKQDFKYGRVEARIKLPTGQGTFPAFWMLPTDNTYGFWPNSGEIDIMENGSGGPSIGGAIHYLNPQSNSHTYQTQWVPASPSEFNVYRIDWHPDEIRWFLNDEPYWTADKASWRNGPHAVGTSDNAPFDQDFHIVLNLAIGGSIGGAINNGEFPAGGHKMLVDYVRVYECQDGPNACKYTD